VCFEITSFPLRAVSSVTPTGVKSNGIKLDDFQFVFDITDDTIIRSGTVILEVVIEHIVATIAIDETTFVVAVGPTAEDPKNNFIRTPGDLFVLLFCDLRRDN
jgi:hypothetical protein